MLSHNKFQKILSNKVIFLYLYFLYPINYCSYKKILLYAINVSSIIYYCQF